MPHEILRCLMLATSLVLIAPAILAADMKSHVTPVQQKHQQTTRPSPDIQNMVLSDKSIGSVVVNQGGCVITFPSKPTKVVLGREGQFDAQYIEKDVALLPTSPRAATNLFVYLGPRRFTFRLSTSELGGSRIVVVRSPSDTLMEVEMK